MHLGRAVAHFSEQIDSARTDIWRYARFYDPLVDQLNRLSLGEGWSANLEIPEIAASLGLDKLVFKREDLNPTGSHKARSLAFQVSKAKQERRKALVISSSGNAAVAAAAYASLAGIVLYAFVSPRTNPVKKREIAKLGAVLVETDRAINLAKYAARKFGIENLRPSSNDASIEGFKSIGFEIFETVGDVDAVFTFVSSGSSLLGIQRAYSTLSGMGLARTPALYAVHAGALSAEGENVSRSSSLAGALGVKRTRRAGAVLKAVRESGGQAVLTNDGSIVDAAAALAGAGILTSAEGVASFAALKELSAAGKFSSAVCILTGHSSQWPLEDAVASRTAATEEDVDRLMNETLL